MKKPYYITYYCGFPKTEKWRERYDEVIACGFNLLQLEYGDVQTKQEMLRYCEEKGVRASMHDRRITDIVSGDWEKWQADPDGIDAVIKEVCEDYRDFPALYNYRIIDEPIKEKHNLLKMVVEAFRKYDPAHICYINQWPLAAFYMDEEWVQDYMDVVKPDMLSYDQYHFCTDNRQEENCLITDEATARAYAAKQNRIDRDDYFKGLERARKIGLERNIPYMLIVLLTEHGPYRYLLPEEISFEAYHTLAYGCASLSYFRYWNGDVSPEDKQWRDQNSCLQGEGDNLVRCQHYYDVQAINKEVQPIGEYIVNTVSEAVFHIDEEAKDVQVFTEYKDIRNISGGKFTVGFFEDGSFLIANKDYINESTCVLDTDTELEVFDTKTAAFVSVGEKQFTIPAGGGVYLRRK